MTVINIIIDGKKVEIEDGATILQAARAAKIHIPTLCHDDRLKPFGACRMCLVHVEGSRKLMAACSTPAEPGMKVTTHTPEIERLRQTILELLLVHHPLDCPICDAAGECELQDYTYKLGRPYNRFLAMRKHQPTDKRAPLLERDMNRCIFCGKCVRICTEVQGVHAIDFAKRGFKTEIAPAFGRTLECEFCGQCVSVCPVGALYTKVQKYKTRSWFLKSTLTICNYCATGCTIELRAEDHAIHRVRAPLDIGVNRGNLCGRGRFGFEFVNSQQRLLTPMIRKNNRLQEASWEEALNVTAQKLDQIRKSHGGEVMAGLGSPRCTNEDNYLFRKFMRSVLGSPHLDSIVSLGYAQRQRALESAFGQTLAGQTLDRFGDSDLILVVESDVSDANPVFSLEILRAKFQKRASLLVANAKSSKLTHHADQWLRLRPGSGISLLNALCAEIIPHVSPEIRNIKGFNELERALGNISMPGLAQDTGLNAEEIRLLYGRIRECRKPVVVMTLGVHENAKGSGLISAAANLALLKGCGPEGVAVPGELCNLQGLLDIGVQPDPERGRSFWDWMRGFDIKSLCVMGEDPLSHFPDKHCVKRFLESLEFLVVQDMFLTQTASLANVVFPSCSFAEKYGTFTNSDLLVQRVRPGFAPLGQSRPDWSIIMELASRLGHQWSYTGAEAISSEILKEFKDQKNSQSSDAYKLNPVTPYQKSLETDGDFPLCLFIGNLQHHALSWGIYNQGLMSAEGHSELLISPVDAERAGVQDGDRVELISNMGRARSYIKIDESLFPRYAYTSAHFPEDEMNAIMPMSDRSQPLPIRIQVRKISC